MKKIFIFISFLFFLSCNLKSDIDVSRRSKELQKELPWLKELIQKAENDDTGNYIGSIWINQYEGKDYFITDMMLGSGGVAYWVFDYSGKHFAHNGTDVCTACEFVGNKHFYTKDDEFPVYKLKKDDIVYSSSFFIK